MATFVTGKYLTYTVALTDQTAHRLVDLIIAQFGETPQDSWREVTLQVDPEGTSDQIRIGDSRLGTTGGNGKVQKGVTLAGGDSLTETTSLTLVPLGSIFVQAVTSTPNLNVQLLPQ